jgi:inhibitor of KinA
MPHPQIIPYGDRALLLQFASGIYVDGNRHIHEVANAIIRQQFSWVLNVTPAYHSLLVEYEPCLLMPVAGKSAFEVVQQCLLPMLSISGKLTQSDSPDVVTIDVCYHPSLKTDMAEVSALTGLPPAQIVQLHTEPVYHIFMMGFLPGFPYMGPLPESLVLPRKKEPVTVTAGAVAIAGNQTGIYPAPSPGGWYVLGYTRQVLFDVRHKPAVSMQAGMQVRFNPISLEQFEMDWA